MSDHGVILINLTAFSIYPFHWRLNKAVMNKNALLGSTCKASWYSSSACSNFDWSLNTLEKNNKVTGKSFLKKHFYFNAIEFLIKILLQQLHYRNPPHSSMGIALSSGCARHYK